MKIKVAVEDLTPGMYVAELDKPWIESSFLFQGFAINSQDEMEQIGKQCRHVYIDAEKTAPEICQQLKQRHAARNGKKSKTFTDTRSFNINENDEIVQADIQQRIAVARTERNKTRKYVDSVLEDVRLGASVDTKAAKVVVSSMVDNIVSSMDASMWLTQLKKRDEYTAIHSVNVCVLSISFGNALGLTKPQLNLLGLGALLHDIGKMKVPLDVLNKPGKLSDEEFDLMKTHPRAGYDLLKDDPNIPAESLDVVLSHHERLNGRGYPNRLAEGKINYLTCIASIVDVYDAITSDRVYHDGMAPHKALRNMYNWAPGNFDQSLIEAFIKTIGIYPLGSVVEFRSGHVGIVVRVNKENKLKPVVMLLLNRKKQPYDQHRMINLANPEWNKKSKSVEICRIVEPREFNLDVSLLVAEQGS